MAELPTSRAEDPWAVRGTGLRDDEEGRILRSEVVTE